MEEEDYQARFSNLVKRIKDKKFTDDEYQELSFHKHYQQEYEPIEEEFKEIVIHNDQNEDNENDEEYPSNKLANLLIYEEEKKRIQSQMKQLKQQMDQLMIDEKELNNLIEKEKVNAISIIQLENSQKQQAKSDIMSIVQSKQLKKQEMVDENLQNKRFVWTEEEKNNILAATSHFSLKEISEFSEINLQLLYKWQKKGTQSIKKTGKKIQSIELEEYLVNYIKEQRINYIVISRKYLKAIAKIKATDLGLDLKVSDGYLQKFLKRNKFKYKKINTTMRIFAEQQKVDDFIKDLKQKIESQVYDLDHVINFDESSLQKEYSSNYTITVEKEKHVRSKVDGNPKVNYSIGLSISFSGIKLSQSIIWPSVGKKQVFDKKKPDNIQIYYRKKGSYFDVEKFQEWIHSILVAHSKSLNIDKRGLLIIDNFSGHKYPSLEQDLDTIRYDLLYFPPNSTYLLQPLDLKIMKYYKQYYSEEYMNFNLLNGKSKKKLSHSDFLDLLSKVWLRFSKEQIESAWAIYNSNLKLNKEIKQNKQEIVVIVETVEKSNVNLNEFQVLQVQKDDDSDSSSSDSDSDNSSSSSFSDNSSSSNISKNSSSDSCSEYNFSEEDINN
ncbi:hypothetical protein ABPG72_014428 [Tetrahymena utriculariae]